MNARLTGFFVATLLGSTAIASATFAQSQDAEAGANAEAETIPSPLPESETGTASNSEDMTEPMDATGTATAEGAAQTLEDPAGQPAVADGAGEQIGGDEAGMADITAGGVRQPTDAEQAGAAAGDSLTTPTQDEAAAAEGATTAPVEGDPSVLATETTEQPAAADTAGADAAGTEWRTGRAALTRPAIEREGYAMAEAGAVTLEEIQGATVYGIEDENIATVGDVVIGPDGEIQYFLMDVGGFLGIGAREVAVGFDEVTILSTEGRDDFRVYVGATQEELENLPEYEVR